MIADLLVWLGFLSAVLTMVFLYNPKRIHRITRAALGLLRSGLRLLKAVR